MTMVKKRTKGQTIHKTYT